MKSSLVQFNYYLSKFILYKKFIVNKLILSLSFLLLSLTLQSCGFFSETKELNIQYNASAQLNPDINGEASPIVVTMYQLKSLEDFNENDYFALTNNVKNVLGNNLISQYEIEIRPDQKLKISKEIGKETKFIGFIASYRNINNAVWKNVVSLDSVKGKKISITLDSDTIKNS